MLTGLFFKGEKNTKIREMLLAIDANIIIRSGFDVLVLVVSAALLNTTLMIGLFFKGRTE